MTIFTEQNLPFAPFDSTAIAVVEGDTTIELNTSPIYVGIVHDSSGFVPSSAVYISDCDGPDEVIQEAFAALEDLQAGHMTPEETKERDDVQERDGFDTLTEGYDGFVFITTGVKLQALIEGIENKYNAIKFKNIEFEACDTE